MIGDAKCFNKKAYDSYRAADKASYRLNRYAETRSTAYRCSECGKYHVGRTMGNKRKKEHINRKTEKEMYRKWQNQILVEE